MEVQIPRLRPSPAPDLPLRAVWKDDEGTWAGTALLSRWRSTLGYIANPHGPKPMASCEQTVTITDSTRQNWRIGANRHWLIENMQHWLIGTAGETATRPSCCHATAPAVMLLMVQQASFLMLFLWPPVSSCSRHGSTPQLMITWTGRGQGRDGRGAWGWHVGERACGAECACRCACNEANLGAHPGSHVMCHPRAACKAHNTEHTLWCTWCSTTALKLAKTAGACWRPHLRLHVIACHDVAHSAKSGDQHCWGRVAGGGMGVGGGAGGGVRGKG